MSYHLTCGWTPMIAPNMMIFLKSWMKSLWSSTRWWEGEKWSSLSYIVLGERTPSQISSLPYHKIMLQHSTKLNTQQTPSYSFLLPNAYTFPPSLQNIFICKHSCSPYINCTLHRPHSHPLILCTCPLYSSMLTLTLCYCYCHFNRVINLLSVSFHVGCSSIRF